MCNDNFTDAKIEKLIKLYERSSKHSNYQILPPELEGLISNKDLHVKSRYEKERMSFIQKKLNFKNSVFCDIGCNCGYFSFEALKAGAKKGDLFEGNMAHAEFVKLAAEILGIEDQVTVYNKYFTFEKKDAKIYDIGLLLNVLHHVGDDYGSVKRIGDAKRQILEGLNCMTFYVKKLVFQLGFNWMGNRDQCLFENGTKGEMIHWVKDGIKDDWNVIAIGVAVKEESGICYQDVNSENIKRMDQLGEFLNRPIFILENRRMGSNRE